REESDEPITRELLVVDDERANGHLSGGCRVAAPARGAPLRAAASRRGSRRRGFALRTHPFSPAAAGRPPSRGRRPLTRPPSGIDRALCGARSRAACLSVMAMLAGDHAASGNLLWVAGRRSSTRVPPPGVLVICGRCDGP